ncbi:DEAD/DEAH box helicase family protein [Leucobacter sp. UT-8R-CII-1-4]|uniref:DEAD/DEAH box helicase n=1 Tax=Leucobacter sp. UT-8R-CII-1-4 TaxID=3040075 RepID=UPI0024A8C3A9|nr:type ISP restriction/modification enzyme [Leucobacter sp. UT-8R-CII-1-4]MDI6023156.1 DEAD/DEAH box helicase family protein [Leucobacter sp. UT-8R-CII-1-4]
MTNNDVSVSSIHDVLAQYRKVAFDEYDKGSHFERLMQAFLKTEPQYEALYDEVWRWSEYPERGNRPDTGIDLVARSRDTGELTAIQCKFFAPKTTVTKGMLDSFLSASGKMTVDYVPEFTSRLVVSTSDTWGKNAEDAITDQTIPVERLRVQDLDESSIDWSQFVWGEPGSLSKKAHKTPFDYQETAISNVVEGFGEHDRGKLIMACGTGKTFTSLRLAEKTVPLGGTVLFLVPSIALLSQTLKEWTIQAEVPLRSFAVCSDVSVGKRRTEEDIPVRDLAFPATTNANALITQFNQGDASNKLTVVFSTYQSLAVISKAQGLGLPEFDLIICDEAHRTTGAAMAEEDESAFMKVHDQTFVQGAKRLYMTATPRIFSDGTRKKAGEIGAKLADMDDETVYGPEFHRLGFGEAVSMGRLTDYKVLVLAVDEDFVAREFQSLMSQDGYELAMEDTAKIVGTWNGLSKRSVRKDEYADDPIPMQRAVMFAKDIATSRRLSDAFQHVIEGEIQRLEASGEDTSKLLHTESQHVDGTQSMLVRNEKIDWLKQPSPENTVRILSNAKCLSEGVDVPALDAVMFMNPRKSVVDVVQSVGRVMRKMKGKKFGYVILPIAVPSDVEPDQALNNNDKYRVVWQVLQALRAHDERFDAEVNKIDLTKKTNRLMVDVIGAGGGKSEDEEDTATKGADKINTALQLDFSKIEAWRDAILSKIVQKVGERRYWENWAKDVASIAEAHTTRIEALIGGENKLIREEFEAFTEGLRLNLNPDISHNDAVQMLSQHLITQPVFDALFEGYEFSENNPVSQVMNQMVKVLDEANLDTETVKLEKFYESVRTRAAGIDDPGAKQTIVKELYEKFFSTAFSRTSEKLGIVYTPNEIVDFIIHSVNDILKDEFDTSLSDEGVHILDPFTGTGTFIVRLLQSGLIKPHDLARKYRYELHANEIVLLAYYVAAINIEETYHSLQGGNYVPFDGIVLTDTFQMFEDDDELDDMGVFKTNNDRVVAQKERDIRVVIGNPPYSKGQTSGNDDNQNNSYPTLDSHIRDSYAARSTATNKNNLYDSYIRAIRWASDRVGDNGIVGYVSNGGYIDGNTADGLRLSLMDEFTSVYVFNLRGNQRTAGEQSRKEGGKVFGSGSRATIAIALLVKNPKQQLPGKLHYYDIGDYLDTAQKLGKISAFGSASVIPWKLIDPTPEGDWINKRNDDFAKFAPIGEKDKAKARETRVFESYGRGLATARDSWVYSFSEKDLSQNVSAMVAFFNGEVDRRALAARRGQAFKRNVDATQMSWNRADATRLDRGEKLPTGQSTSRTAMYRAFQKQHVVFDRDLNDMVYKLNEAFPSQDTENIGIYYVGAGSAVPFSVLMLDCLPDLHVTGAGSGGQFFPRFSYRPVVVDSRALDIFDEGDSPAFERIDNITDEILVDYRNAYGVKTSKDDIFFYVYGLLHSREYRADFEADLMKMLPRIPKVKAFKEFVAAGRALSDLHLNYETVEPYALTENVKPNASLRVTKMRYAKDGRKDDKTTIIYNDDITITGIPEEAHEYLLGSRSALDWIVERYQVKTDKASGIINDPNAWGDEHGDPRYILDLIKRITTVSVETVKIVKGLPALEVLG